MAPLESAIDMHENPDAKANLAVNGGELYYDKDGRLHVDAVNKMKKIDTITSEERAFFFPNFEKNSNLKMVANRMNLPPRPEKQINLEKFVDQIYTHDEEILSRHSDPANFMTTQDKNLFGISHNWNPVLRGSDEQKQIIQAKKLREKPTL